MSSPTSTPATAPAVSQDAIACRDAVTSAEAVVDAARTGVDHWRRHVGSRTDMLAGKITQDEARAIWKATKRPGPEDQKVFAEREDAYEPHAAACTQVDLAAVPAELSEAASQCVERSEAAVAAVQAGLATMADWADHLANMARFAEGDFDAAHAQHLWESAWSEAPVNIDAFRSADEALKDAPTCDVGD